jgi:hypothetical protein
MYNVPDSSNNPLYKSATQMLIGPGNPKTMIPPSIVARPMDISFWQSNNLVKHSGINAQSETDPYSSGYYIRGTKENFEEKVDEYTPHENAIFQDRVPNISTGVLEPEPANADTNTKRKVEFCGEMIDVAPNQPGMINTVNGYYPENITKDLPTNFEASKYDQDSEYREHRENLFTQTLQPGVYDKNEIIEPINSNMGISFSQQFQPVTVDKTSTGDLFVQRDPRLSTPSFEKYTSIPNITERDVYDPRHTGYGPCYRSYTEPITGQTRFMYDDINAVRMPSYISRSNIDFAMYADTYGPIPEGWENGNPNTENIKELAEASFMNSTLQQRSELQQRLMRKANARKWQTRMLPMHTGGVRGM